MTQLRDLRLELPGAEANGLVRGEGDELVLFLHAVGGSHESFRPQLEAAPPRYTVAAFDFRGHGPGKLDDSSSATLDAFAEDVLSIMGALGFDRAHLCGVSMGGVVAQMVAARRAEAVASLTLASTWAFYGEEEAEGRRAYLRERLAKQTSMLEGSRQDMRFLHPPDAPGAMIEEAARIEASKDPEIFRRSWDEMFGVDLRPALEDLRAPLLLVGGHLDPVTPPGVYLEAIRARVPGARLVTIPGASHFVNVDHAAEFNRALFSFLRENPAPGRALSAPSRRQVPADTTAHALLRLLAERGIDALFSNSGTDYVDIIDALARYEDDPSFRMRVVAAPHENTAISMAHGYFLATGRPAAVMGHVNVGSANMSLGIINAFRARVPVLVMAGKTPHYEEGVQGCRVNFVQWGQDTFDQASFREFLKWDYELKTPKNLEAVVDRALAVAESDPAGPVYLMLPGEPLAEPIPGGTFAFSAAPRQRPAAAGRPDRAALRSAAEAIRRAKAPLVVTAELGRYRGGPSALARFAERLAVPVVEFGKHNFMNMPTSHPMHHGFDPVPAVRGADLVVAVECPVPYIPSFAKLGVHPTQIAVGVDPLRSDIPMRSFPADVCLAGDPGETLLALAELVLDLASEGEREAIAERRARLSREHDELFTRAFREADADAERPAITKRYLSRVLGELVDDETLIFNEYDLDPQLVPRDLPGGWFENSIASGLGWALGAALGAKVAAPERTVVATVGDGSYLFNTPLSAHFVAAAEKLPILIVIFNDRAWSTIKRSYLGARPDGWAAKSGRFPLCDFPVAVDYAKVAEASGGIGIRVESPASLRRELERALDLVRSGDRHVLVDVLCERDA